MRILRRTSALSAAVGLSFAAVSRGEDIKVPKIEDAASAFLTASGAAQALAANDPTAQATAYGSDSAAWSAFLNAASQNLQGGSLAKYASSFEQLKYVQISKRKDYR